MKKTYLSNNIFVLHFCDLLHPNKYAIWNNSDKKLRFGAPWFEIELKKGLNIIGISAMNEAKITYEDRSTIDVDTSYKDYSGNWYRDLIHYHKSYDPAFERQRSIEVETREGLLSFYLISKT